MVNMMILIINKMYMISVIILLFHYSCVHGLPFGNKNPHQLHENHVSHSSHDSHNVTPTSSNPRRSIFSNILKYNGIFVPKTPIRLLPKFGSVIDGSLKTKLFRWPKENTIEVKPIELSTFLKKVPKIAESLWPDSGKLIAKPFPLKNLQNYQLLDINGLNGHHDQPFSDGTYMEIPPPSTLSSPSSIKSIPPHLNQNQRPPNKNQNKPTPLFGKDSDLFSSDFDLMTNDKFPEKTNGGFHLLRPPPFSATGSSLFSPLIPGLNELLDFDRPFKPEPLLPRPISQPMDLFRPRPIHLGGPDMRPQMFPPMLNNGNQQMNNNINNNNNHNKPCTTNGNNNQNNFNSNGNNMNSNGNSNNNNINNIQSSSNNAIVTKPSNAGQNSIKSTITESRQGPIIFYRFDDPQIKTIPKDQLFPIFIPNPDTSGQTTKMEVIIQKQETVASTRAPVLRHRRRNRHKLRDDHDDFDDNVVDNSHRDRLTSVAASDDVDYADEYADDLSGYDLKESDNLEIFEDEEPPDNSKQKKIRTNHRKYSDSPRSTSSSSASRIIKYQAIESNKPHRQRLTARPRLRFRSDTVRSDTVRIKPQASSVHNSRLMRGSHGLRHTTVPLNSNSGGIGGSGSGSGGGGGGGGGNIGTSNIATGEISGLSLSSGDPNKVSRENKVKTGDRTTFDKGIERSKHRVFEQKQEEIWKEKKWNKGGKENTEVESVGTVTEKDKRGARGLQQKSRILRYGDKQLRSDDEKAYYDDDLGNNNEGEIPNGEDDRDGEEDNARASQIDQRYTQVTWSPEIHSSGWKKSHHSV